MYQHHIFREPTSHRYECNEKRARDERHSLELEKMGGNADDKNIFLFFLENFNFEEQSGKWNTWKVNNLNNCNESKNLKINE